jgi:hypothetical protein
MKKFKNILLAVVGIVLLSSGVVYAASLMDHKVNSVFLGNATLDGGQVKWVMGAQIGDPEVILTTSADANGDFSITPDTGDITLASADDVIMTQNDVNIVGNTITTGTATDYALSITQTLNDSSAPGGTDVYTGIKFDLTETDITSWDNVYLADLLSDSASEFRVENDGDVLFSGGDANDVNFTTGGGDIVFNNSPVVGPTVLPESGGRINLVDLPVGASATGIQGYDLAVDSNSLADTACDPDGSGGVEDCHFRQFFAPVYVPSAQQTLSNDGTIDCASGVVDVIGSGGTALLDTDPAIADGDYDGQVCQIRGSSDANDVQIADNVNTQNVGAATCTLGVGDNTAYTWNATIGDWVMSSPCNNV